MTVKPITSYEELKNIISLGLDVWVYMIWDDDHREVWCLKGPKLSQGTHGPKLGGAIIQSEYLPFWGIEDIGCPHPMHEQKHSSMQLFNSKEDAQMWHVTRGHKS